MGLAFLWFRGPRAILLPIFGIALGAIAVPLGNYPIAIALIWTVAMILPQERPGLRSWALTAISSGILRWLALNDFAGQDRLAAFLAMQTIPRASIIALAWVSRPGDDGPGYEFSTAVSTPVAIVSIVIGLVTAALCGIRTGIVLVLGTYLILRTVRWFAYRYRGGADADAFAAAQLLIEIAILLLFTCGYCRF